MRPRSLFRVLSVAVVLVLAAQGCGGGDDPPRGLLADAGERTFSAGSARASFTVELAGSAAIPDDTVVFDGEGVFDFRRQAGRMSMDISDALAGAGAGTFDGSVEVLTDDMVVYLRVPFLNEVLGIDTPWLRLDLAALTEDELGADLRQLTQFTGNDPRSALAMLRGVADEAVDELGREQVRGVSTIPYRATVDLEQAYQRAGAVTDQEAFRAFIEEIGRPAVDVDAWVDDAGLLRRIAYTVPLPEASGGEARSSIDLYDFGVEVDLARPAESETTDLSSLL